MASISGTLSNWRPCSSLLDPRLKERKWIPNSSLPIRSPPLLLGDCWRVRGRNLRTCKRKRGAVYASLGEESTLERSSVETEAVIIGAGIAGLATALALKKVGISSIVLERSDALREQGAALSLWPNAWRALDALGVGDELRQNYITLDRVKLWNAKGDLLRSFGFDECNGSPHEVRGLRRSALLQVLADKLPAGTIRFGAQITGYRTSGSKSTAPEVQLQDGSVVRGKVLVGADGTRSSLARHLGLSNTDYAGYSAFRAVTAFPQGHSLGSSIHMVWGQGVRAGMYPLNTTEVYWFTCFNAPQGSVRDLGPEEAKMKALEMVKGWGRGVEDLIRATPAQDISRSEVRDRIMWPLKQGSRWATDTLATLAGDAAHPMTPDLGQGACTALEDAIVLAKELGPAMNVSFGADKGKIGEEVEVSDAGGKDERDAHKREDERLSWEAEAEILSALGKYERERTRRCVPIVLRSRAMGALLQLPLWPVCFVRDSIVGPFPMGSFLDHALYDVGKLS